MKKINEDISSMVVVCPIIQDMKYNKCDYPQLRRELSSRTKKGCARAGEDGKQCVLRRIQVKGGGNIVQRSLYHQEFKSRGDRDPMVEIQQAIQAYEAQKTLTSGFTRWIKLVFITFRNFFLCMGFHGLRRGTLH